MQGNISKECYYAIQSGKRKKRLLYLRDVKMIEINPDEIPEKGFTVVGEGDKKLAVCTVEYYVYMEQLLRQLKETLNGRKSK